MRKEGQEREREKMKKTRDKKKRVGRMTGRRPEAAVK